MLLHLPTQYNKWKFAMIKCICKLYLCELTVGETQISTSLGPYFILFHAILRGGLVNFGLKVVSIWQFSHQDYPQFLSRFYADM